ncbi:MULTISPECIES: ABC transporter ATP-binding protein [unclassified Streptococcus]|uniref:ABC transporter ATP-binding protein n=1 Tax=Streptococcus TaxID=1301 RepID=UPI00101FC693|nr:MULTISPECIES: ABC transporter ATP-binding protein [unclassified Streptococcus]MTQ41739.1 ABC transporter ATP-binding protein [Streptococcus sp. BIOML-A1]RYS60996.1 ABC transporter ATP-binding protein [Streptococcus sp. bf_0095]
MFGKLMKYELKATYKWYLIISGVLAILSIFAGLLASSVITGAATYTADTTYTIVGIIVLVIFAGYIGLTLTNYIIIIRRFYNNIFGREGYLTWTLPTGSHTVLLVKVTSALIWSIFCFISLILSLLIFLGVIGLAQQQNIFDVLGPVFDHIGSSLIWQSLLFQVLATISGILMLYCAISLGQLFINNRIVMAFVFGFILWVVLSIIGRLFPSISISELSRTATMSSDTLSDVLVVNFIPAYIYELVKIVAMYFTVHYVTKFKLNLQ